MEIRAAGLKVSIKELIKQGGVKSEKYKELINVTWKITGERLYNYDRV